MTDSIALLPAVSLLAKYAAKELSPIEVTGAALDRIERYNGRFNAFCLIDADRALAAAAESEQRYMRGEAKGLLDGVPASIKDLVLTEGWPTGWGSKAAMRMPPPDVDAPCVARLREHGARIAWLTRGKSLRRFLMSRFKPPGNRFPELDVIDEKTAA